ncbi:unnamed protein product [Parnassius mnemosyne]|uniref:CCHC-type domain-containing protein n=1 Tax=Parnassius mnemosyne TaxID=213953 RepID=A0AAV1KIA1_9NEOP
MKQESGEKFEKFLIRLRKQADKCCFANKEESMIDQITEKCYSSELRKKILKGGDKMALEDIIIEANTLESVNREMEEFTHNPACNSSTVNKIETRRKMSNKSCTRCGSFKHMPQSMECPARKIKCHKCGITGHFRKYCLTVRPLKRQFLSSKDPTPTKKSRTEEKEEIDYVFHVDDDTTINCWVDGVKTSLLIDSGCKCNLITDVTWRKLKTNKINVF